ncbi:hypothetical protein CL654_02425 [bacterium]|nr:hypothetical protein [bacterium]|tara:strand:- start:7286 stop:8956 length:1671 start_codon:yes stop_codon:yes gene_type:complete
MFNFDLINIAISTVGLITLAFGTIVFLSDYKSRTNFWFLMFILAVLGWIISMVLFRGVESESLRLLYAKVLYFAAAGTPITLIFFAHIFMDEGYAFDLKRKLLIVFPYFFIVFVSLWDGFLIREIIVTPGKEHTIVFTDLYHYMYAVYLNLTFAWVFFILGKKLYFNTGLKRKRVAYVFFGILITAILGTTTNLSLPLTGNFDYNWTGQITVIFMVSALFYAVLKHQLFNTKVVLAEFFVFMLWGFIFLRILTQDDFSQIISDGLLLLGTIIIGILLIRNVIREVQARELLAAANKQLERLNLEKSEFLSIATHQLKTPISEIRNAVSLMLEGSLGEINDKAKEMLGRVFDSAQRQNVILDDFLNVSRIEQGRMKYDFGIVDVRKLVTEITESMKHVASSAGLTLVSEIKQEGDIHVTADYGKIRQIITNLVDNAIKYSKQGEVKIILENNKEQKKIKISVVDRGIGMNKETTGRLFKRFSRAKDVGKIQVGGSGLGLYIAREMVEAHGGRIWAESEGDGKGSVFSVELPFVPPNTNPVQERKREEEATPANNQAT